MIAAVFAFILSPAGRIVMIALALMSAVAFIDRRATYRERARCDAAAMRAERDAALQDLRAEKEAREREKQTITLLEQQKGTDDEARQNLEAELAKRTPAARCELSDPDARRLR